MKCIKCNEELEADDNFCPTCGELTPHGYLSLKDNKLRYLEFFDNYLYYLWLLVLCYLYYFVLIVLPRLCNVLVHGLLVIHN